MFTPPADNAINRIANNAKSAAWIINVQTTATGYNRENRTHNRICNRRVNINELDGEAEKKHSGFLEEKKNYWK